MNGNGVGVVLDRQIDQVAIGCQESVQPGDQRRSGRGATIPCWVFWGFGGGCPGMRCPSLPPAWVSDPVHWLPRLLRNGSGRPRKRGIQAGVQGRCGCTRRSCNATGAPTLLRPVFLAVPLRRRYRDPGRRTANCRHRTQGICPAVRGRCECIRKPYTASGGRLPPPPVSFSPPRRPLRTGCFPSRTPDISRGRTLPWRCSHIRCSATASSRFPFPSFDSRHIMKDHSTPAAMAEPMTPEELQAMACISK